MKDLGPVTKLGMGRRTGVLVIDEPPPLKSPSISSNGNESIAQSATATGQDATGVQSMLIRTRSKRKKRNWATPKALQKMRNREEKPEVAV